MLIEYRQNKVYIVACLLGGLLLFRARSISGHSGYITELVLSRLALDIKITRVLRYILAPTTT